MIGVLTTSYPRAPDDWAGGFVRTRVRALEATGVPVEVIAAGEPLGEPGVVRVPGDLFYGAGAPEVLEAGAAWAPALAFAARFAAAAAARAPAWRVLESHWLVPCGLVGAALAGGRPHRAFAHGGDVALLERLPGGASLGRALVRSGAELIFASDDLRARFVRRCGPAPRAHVEPAPFDVERFVPPSDERRRLLRDQLGCERRFVLGVGRLVPVKGWHVLVRAIGRLPYARRPPLVLVGEGPERARLEGLAARAGVDLRLVGALARSEVADWMAAADLYAQPSVVLANGRREGTPLAVREALAVGLPVIASATGGLGALAHGRLTLVPPAQPDALARAIAQFL